LPRSEPLRLTLTHLLFAGGGRRSPDAVATAEDGARFFLPGWLPCGECGQCRRGWMAACPRGRALADSEEVVEAAERFLAPLDEPAGAPRLEDERAACAGVIAELQELSAKVGLGSGELAVWIGDDARSVLGARLSAGRGCPTFHLGGSAGSGVTALPLSAGAATWNEALATAAAAAPGGFLERRIFLSSAAPALVEAALSLAIPGTSLGLLDGDGGGVVRPGALSSCRLVVAAGFGYHPDLVPEALAALRRDPALTDGLIGQGARDPARLILLRR
jgi:hypothetical protein